jgi:hypothetical protein
MNKVNSWVNDGSLKPVLLKCWSEYIGLLLKVIIKEDGIILCFSNDDFIILPLLKNLKDKAVDLKGCNIAILRTDMRDKEYLIKKED